MPGKEFVTSLRTFDNGSLATFLFWSPLTRGQREIIHSVASEPLTQDRVCPDLRQSNTEEVFVLSTLLWNLFCFRTHGTGSQRKGLFFQSPWHLTGEKSVPTFDTGSMRQNLFCRFRALLERKWGGGDFRLRSSGTKLF